MRRGRAGVQRRTPRGGKRRRVRCVGIDHPRRHRFWNDHRAGLEARRIAAVAGERARGFLRAAGGGSANNEFGYIAENLNRAVAKVSKASSNQEANESLQRSITDLLAVINQIARGDLTLRGKVTNDALGNVADSINYMLDNFTKVLERVRKAAMEVTACSNNILVAADEMQAGATQQDQEITNTSSAV